MEGKIYTLWHVYNGDYEFAASASSMQQLGIAIKDCILHNKSMRFGEKELRRPDQIRLLRIYLHNNATVEQFNQLLAYGEIEERDAEPGDEISRLNCDAPLSKQCHIAIRQEIEESKEQWRKAHGK